MENVKENIKLIDDFMDTDQGGLGLSLTGFSYHNSYDSIMPVVEKIESLGHSVIIDGTQCKIFMDHDWINYYKDSKIESVYASVVKFIQWYNPNKEENGKV